MQEEILKAELEKARARQEEAEGRVTLEERMALNAQRVQQAKELQKKEVRRRSWVWSGGGLGWGPPDAVSTCWGNKSSCRSGMCGGAGAELPGGDPAADAGEAGEVQAQAAAQVAVQVGTVSEGTRGVRLQRLKGQALVLAGQLLEHLGA